MNVLLLGAGAVGVVYGRHLQRAGATVTFMVRDKYAEETRAGITTYPYNESRTEQVVFDPDGVVTSVDEVRTGSWDQLWLCISSTALAKADIGGLIDAVGGDCTVICLQPGLRDRELMLQHVDESRLVMGMIGFIAYQAPLEGENHDPAGIAYWFPPLSPSLFSGPDECVRPAVSMLKKGGCPGKRVKSATNVASRGSAILMPMLLFLESEGWLFGRFASSSDRGLSARGARAALTVVGKTKDVAVAPLKLFVSTPLFIIVGVWFARKIIPFDLETYFAYHFTKTGDQTRAMVREYVDAGRQLGVDVVPLEGLLKRADAAIESETLVA